MDIGDTVTLDKVLLVGSRLGTVVGRPLVAGARVTAVLEELAKDAKVIIFKKRRRKASQTLNGFRRQVAVLRITSIDYEHNAL